MLSLLQRIESSNSAVIPQRINNVANGVYLFIYFFLVRSPPAEFSPEETVTPPMDDPSCSGYVKSRLDFKAERFYLQLSSIRIKSLMPKFSKKTPEDEVVLKKKEMSALSSP